MAVGHDPIDADAVDRLRISAAVGDRVPSTHSDLPTAAAVILASHPLIDVVASLVTAARGEGRSKAVSRINAAISGLAVAALALSGFGSDARAVLISFGAWAAGYGAIQFVVALRSRRSQGRQAPLLISGGLSTIAGISFLAAARADDAHLALLGGYMALGAVL